MGRHRALPDTRRHRARHRRPPRGGLRRLTVAGVLVALVAVLWQPSTAAFTGSTNNPANALRGGRVTISATGAGSAVFSPTNLVPGSSGTTCVLVTYAGDLAASIKLYAANYTDSDLGGALTFTIEQGSGATCGAFGTATVLYSGSLRGFATTATGWANGLGTFTPSGAGEAKPYRFTYLLHGDSDARGDIARVDLVWQSRST